MVWQTGSRVPEKVGRGPYPEAEGGFQAKADLPACQEDLPACQEGHSCEESDRSMVCDESYQTSLNWSKSLVWDFESSKVWATSRVQVIENPP